MIYIVTPSYNAVETIEQTILGVVTQAGNFSLHYHIQDGASTDGTIDLLNRWKERLATGTFPIQCNDIHFTYRSEPDQGMYDAIVKGFSGMSALSDDFMTWINADDILFPGALSFIQTIYDSFSSEHVSWISGAVAVMKNHLPIAIHDRPLPTVVVKNGLCDGVHWEFVQQEGTFFRRWLWNAVDADNILKKYRYAGDWDLWRLFAQHANLVQSQWPLGVFRLRDGQLSQKYVDIYRSEIEATIETSVRREALKNLAERKKVTRQILRSKYPSGDFLLIEKGANNVVRGRYEKLFGECSQSHIDNAVDGDLKQRVILEAFANANEIDADRNNQMHPPPIHIDLSDFQKFTYARRSHWQLFEGLDVEFFGSRMHLDEHQLKVYQDLLVFTFIKDHIPPGSRILDVGGGMSRILNSFYKTHECWNIDKLEGLGNGPKDIGQVRYRFVRDYMGNFNPELPNKYFDFVFSISALEHVPQDSPDFFDHIIDDIDRVLKPGGYSLHLFDVIFKKNGFWTNKFIYRIFERVRTVNRFVPPEDVRDDPDLYCMSEEAYNKTWFHSIQKPYLEHGRPSNLAILWKKEGGGESSRQILPEKKSPVCISTTNDSFIFYVVTPSLNVKSTIDRTIESVVSQAGDFSIRYHVQDGGSTDGTLDRLKHWDSVLSRQSPLIQCRNVVFTWSSEADHGMYDAIVNGFDRMRIDPNDFMTWINGDDELIKDAFATVTKISRENPEIQWMGGPTYVIDDNGPILQRDAAAPTDVIREGLCDGLHWYHLQQEGMFFRKALWFRGKHGLQGFRFAGDWNLWRVFAHYADFYQYSEPFGAFRRRKGQLSIERIKEYQAEIDNTISNKERYQAFSRLYRNSDLFRYLVRNSESSKKCLIRKDVEEPRKIFEYHWKNVHKHRLEIPTEKIAGDNNNV